MVHLRLIFFISLQYWHLHVRMFRYVGVNIHVKILRTACQSKRHSTDLSGIPTCILQIHIELHI